MVLTSYIIKMTIMADLISEKIVPFAGTFDASAMGRGEPGLSTGVTWRDEDYTIVERIESWKKSSPEGGLAGNEVYLRRHYYKLRMNDGSVWTVYFIRQTPKSGNAKHRWFLYTWEEG